jgi:murein DD-endopeptidase MepM/ murein hydrolase activator NlpD
MPNRQTYESYTVQKGDTVAAIAKRFGTTVGAIAVTSGLLDPNKIKVGQVLSIPVASTYDPDELDLAEVKVTAQRVPVAARVASPVGDPVVSLVMAAGEWLKPPKLWVTLAVAAGVGYYLIDTDRRSRRR